ncbi:hypothetical protein BDN70DRAFT_108222 [Pholiota conissans]|uniref:Homeobox domain-containing protein n=1 Tax=Pholiota conissans TaxID=109636 RepID=A0A9P5ZBX6_9AGAR|nr:hypothetical protein BDN70DRAFT_108222 [Pholiota conissans]
MREEVGRSIGLSARKVQIWFQNQRQKSRRPRSQSDTPSNRPPQYGPFPTVSESASHHMSSTHAYEEHALGRVPYAHQQQHQQPAPQVSPRLLGPGMPGVSRYPPHAAPAEQPPPPYRLGPASMSSQSLAAPSAFSAHRAIHRALSPPPYRSPRMYSHPGTRPATSQPTASTSTTMSYRDFDPSRTLPPLVSTRPRSSSHHYGPPPPSSSSSRLLHSSGSAGSSSAHAFPGVGGSAAFPPLHAPHHAHPRSLSPEPMFAHQPPEPSPRPLLHLPPPFTLEPSPQWDEAAYSAVPRPSSSVWSRPSSRSTRGRSASPVASRHHLGAASEASPAYYSGSSDHLAHAPAPTSPRPMSSAPAITPPTASSRAAAGRYDPIRASFNAVFPAPSASVRSPPYDDDDRHSGGGGRAEDPHRPPP